MVNIGVLIRSILLLCLVVFSFPDVLFSSQQGDQSPVDLHSADKYTDDLSGLLEKRYVRILTTFNKTNYFLSGTRQYGFEYSLMKEYEKFLNKGRKRRDLSVVFEFIPVPRDQLVSALVNGLGDIAAAGLTITSERSRDVDFTNPYLTGIDEVIVVNKNLGRLKNLDDLSGKEIFVRQSSSYYQNLLSLNRKFSKKGMQPVRIVRADENFETEDILEMVNSGAIGITVSDSHIAGIWSGVFDDLRVLEHLKIQEGGKIAWMVRKNNPNLKASLNKFIKKHRKGTLLGNIYFNRYYKSAKHIKNPLTTAEREKQRRCIELFKKYADKYGFDWMLIMAVAYQESGLDNSKTNPSGAVGIMQVLPSTARDKKIGISDVQSMENNIHAGVKYLAFLRDHYFNDLNLKDQISFTLAAYNAGPAKIRKTRRLAGKMGFDPDRWFRNVEMAALRLIGQETVRYVSNINKYYTVFRLDSKNRQVRSSAKKKIIKN